MKYYRILMNGNGLYRVQSRTWRFGTWVSRGRRDWHTSRCACKFLLKVQQYDARLKRDDQWSVVVTDVVKG